MTIDLTQVAVALISLVSVVITVVVIPWVRSKIANEESKLTEAQRTALKILIRTGVEAAEQLYNSDEGQKKKAYVRSLLENQGYKIDSAALNAAIESAVLELHRNLN